MNGRDMKQKLSAKGGRAEQLLQDKRPVEEKIADLYLLAYCRQPTGEELQSALGYLAKAKGNTQRTPANAQKAELKCYEDLLWAMINTKEFLFNH